MSNLYRGHSTDASYQSFGSFCKAVSEKKILEIEQSETRIACDGHVFNESRNEQS
jgi:hypothetical protein